MNSPWPNSRRISLHLDSFAAFTAIPLSITLLDGSVVDDTSELTLDQGTYHVTWYSAGGANDVTAIMKRADKQAVFPGFDITKDNLRLFNEGRGGVGPSSPLNTSVTSILTNQLYNDPFAAPIEQAGKVVGGAGNAAVTALGTPGVQKALVLGFGLLALWLMWPKIMKVGGR